VRRRGTPTRSASELHGRECSVWGLKRVDRGGARGAKGKKRVHSKGEGYLERRMARGRIVYRVAGSEKA